MKKKEEAIENLQKLANNTIDGFTKENNILLKHLQDQFDILYSEHGFVDERIKNGYESTKSRFFGVIACVTLPEQKKPLKAEDLTQSRIDLSDDFSPFFLEINNYYDQLKKFGTKVQSHLNNVAGTRKAWNENHPDFPEFKDRARLLPKEYEPLAKECNFVYEKLTHHNEKLEDLKNVLSKKLSDKMNQIRESKQLMIDTFKTYAEESQKLDRTMNGILTVCKDIRFLTAQTVEKYPISKDKEDQKEVKEVLAL